MGRPVISSPAFPCTDVLPVRAISAIASADRRLYPNVRGSAGSIGTTNVRTPAYFRRR